MPHDPEQTLMQPKVDYVFKLIFGDPRHKENTVALLSAILGLPREEMAELEIINSELLREFQEDKKGILDVRIQLRDGRQIDVEVQILPTGPMPERTLFYWARMYAGQIKAGDSYHQLKKCITINIVDFHCTPDQRLHSCFHLTEDTTGHRLTDVLEVHFLELPRLREAIAAGTPDHPLMQWMLFIDCESPEVIKMLAQDNKDIRQAYTLLEVISQDKIKRMAYEARQAELMDQRSRMISAEMKGREEGREEVAKALLTRGMSVDDVAEVAGMNREQVAEMQTQMQTPPSNA
jgi:predicted transposase/invertase (TIGR01784 family)